MNQAQYIPLRLHTEFSITDGTVRIKEAVKTAKAQGLPALGISDLMNFFGLVKFYKACRGEGIKPIMGVDVMIKNHDQLDQPYRLMLIARNDAGYLRLCELLTQAYLDDDKHKGIAQLDWDWLQEGDNSGLICLSGAHLGAVGVALMAGKDAEAKEAAQALAGLFPNRFYLELQRLPELPQLETCVAGSLKLADELSLPVVATHPTQFWQADDYEAHEVRVCIAAGYVLADKRRPKDFQPSQFFVDHDDFVARFADIPEALQNSLEIAKRCNLTIVLGKNFLPQFPTPDGLSLDDYLSQLSYEGLDERMAVLYPDEAERAERMPEYAARLQFELDTITQMGFPGYFLIVADFINWAKNNGCPVGPGRGSGAGSLVAYALKITDLDPLKYALLFERFLNPERVSMPDFDIDFCQENRGRVIDYVRHQYGEEAVSQIVTFGTMSSKAVVRDVGRVLDLPFGLCDRLSKLIPVEANKPLGLAKAMEAEPQIGELLDAEEAHELMDLAKKLEDLTRGLGMHAGGVLIAPGKLTDFCPVYRAPDATATVSMYDKDDVEQVGLVKFDFLGLRNLTIIELAQNYIKYLTNEDVDVNHIPLDDAPAYKVFASGNTTAVFQFESTGMKRMLMEAKPTKFEEIIAFVALYRPGPMDLIPDFTRRIHGEKFEYLHPLLEPVLEPTYGVMVYQEQVMQAAQVVGGYSLGGADLLRRAMGKKKVEEMVEHRGIFVAGAAEKDIPADKANEIFDYMEKFAGYGFNKSHAAAYALVAYQTAWLKAHYCSAFMAATMSSELDNTDQLQVFYEDAKNKNSITFLPPDVNESFYRFVPTDATHIRYALGAIKGTGEGAVEEIVKEREANGPFVSLFDFCERIGKGHVNKRTMEALVRAGAFDAIDPNRAKMFDNIALAMEYADQAAANRNQGGLFDDFSGEEEVTVDMVDVAPWDDATMLAEEKQAMGFYFSKHPFDAYAKEIRSFLKQRLANIREGKATLSGFVTAVRVIMGRRGKMAFVTLEDGEGLKDKVEVMFAGQSYETYASVLKADQVLVMEVKINRDDYGGGTGLRIMGDTVYSLDEAREHYARSVFIKLTEQDDPHQVAELLRPYQNPQSRVTLKLSYQNSTAYGELRPGRAWQIVPASDLIKSLGQLLGPEAVEVMW
ncbi:MAG: DNA polymerase III subunit alpha [Neisseriaceae bacterium]|nr:DNA polymerase III subunit alpha [Neisseriaceae bacterium]MBP6862993.1 DNA polymerase III subunit alpha [Neisseriaceae bacterium]